MLLALLLAICVAIVAYCAWAGYRTGALARVVQLLVLTVSYLAAWFVYARGATLPGLQTVPALFQPLLFGVLLALVIFPVLSLFGKLALRTADARPRRRKNAEEPERPTLARSPWNRRLGAVIGGLEGLIAAAALLIVVYLASMIALVTDTTRGLPAGPGAAAQPASRAPSLLSQLGREIKHSPITPMVDQVAPIRQRQIEALPRLSRLAENPRALQRFNSDPRIRRLAEHPRVRALENDPTIVKAVREKRWMDLMNNPTIVALTRDPDLHRQIKDLDLQQVLDDALESKTNR